LAWHGFYGFIVPHGCWRIIRPNIGIDWMEISLGRRANGDHHGRSRIHGALGRSAIREGTRLAIFLPSIGLGTDGAGKMELGPQVKEQYLQLLSFDARISA